MTSTDQHAPAPELSLGTVQFGLAYGIAGRGTRVPDDEVRRILELASDRGLRTLDTAGAYGDIEEHLGRLIQGLPFRIVSKIPAVPPQLGSDAACDFVLNAAEQSLDRLGKSLIGLMFHRSEDLDGPLGDAIWQTLSHWGSARQIAVGASFYDPVQCCAMRKVRNITIAQIPGNPLDQRWLTVERSAMTGVDVHLRSVFLQGLLLMSYADAVRLVPSAEPALFKWGQWCERHAMSPLEAALSVARSFSGVSTIVVGVDRLDHLRQITDAWEVAKPLRAPELACDALDVIDPRLWRRPAGAG